MRPGRLSTTCHITSTYYIIFDIIMLYQTSLMRSISSISYLLVIPGEGEVCRNNADCQKWNAKMDCVHKHRVVKSKMETKLVASGFLKEAKPGQCHLGKMSSIAYIQL